jgi:hypothetical protein
MGRFLKSKTIGLMGSHFGTSFVKGFKPITTKSLVFDSKHTKVYKNYFIQKV